MPTANFRNGSAAQYPLPAGVVARLRFTSTLETLLASAAAAESDNLRINGTVSSPPTISTVDVFPTGLATGHLFFNNTDSDINAFGGGEYIVAQYRQFINTTAFASLSGGADGVGHSTTGFRVGGVTSSPRVVFWYSAPTLKYRFIVGDANGENLQYVNTTGVAGTGSAAKWWVVDFGGDTSAKTVFMEGRADANCKGISVNTDYTIAPISAPLHLMVVGDSIPAGTGPAHELDCWAQITPDRLGLLDCTRSCAGGTGYVADNSGTGLKLYDRRTDITAGVLNRTPDIILLNMGVNDISPVSTADITTQTALNIATYQSAFPGIPIFVTGRLHGGGATPTADHIARENAIFAGVDAAASPFTIKLPIATADTVPTYATSDGVHPNEAGSVSIDAHFRPLIISGAQAALAAMASL